MRISKDMNVFIHLSAALSWVIFWALVSKGSPGVVCFAIFALIPLLMLVNVITYNINRKADGLPNIFDTDDIDYC